MTFMQKLRVALVLFGLFAGIYLLNEGAPISATAVNTGPVSYTHLTLPTIA